jgi:hypothetical protein
MLDPANPLLLAIRGLPVSRNVRSHSVIGTGSMLGVVEPSDGVVPVESAIHAFDDSVAYVKVRHERVHRDGKTVRHVQAILSRHVAEFAAERFE